MQKIAGCCQNKEKCKWGKTVIVHISLVLVLYCMTSFLVRFTNPSKSANESCFGIKVFFEFEKTFEFRF